MEDYEVKRNEIKFSNGTLIVDIDGDEISLITVKFEDFGDVFPVREIQIFWSSCGAEMIQLFEVLLKLPVEQLWERFLQYVGAIMLTSDVYRIRFSRFVFSNTFFLQDPIFLCEQKFEDVKIGESVKVISPYDREHFLTYVDEESKELRVGILESHYGYQEFMKLKECTDEKFDEYVARMIRLWTTLLHNKSINNTIVKMMMIGCLYPMWSLRRNVDDGLRRDSKNDLHDSWGYSAEEREFFNSILNSKKPKETNE